MEKSAYITFYSINASVLYLHSSYTDETKANEAIIALRRIT